MSKRQKACREISQWYCMCWHCPIKSNSAFEQGPITEQMWFGSDITSALVHSHSQTGAPSRNLWNVVFACSLHNTPQCGVLPCYCGSVITGPASALTSEKALRSPQLMTDMFLICSQSDFWEATKSLSGKIRLEAFINSKDLSEICWLLPFWERHNVKPQWIPMKIIPM